MIRVTPASRTSLLATLRVGGIISALLLAACSGGGGSSSSSSGSGIVPLPNSTPTATVPTGTPTPYTSQTTNTSSSSMGFAASNCASNIDVQSTAQRQILSVPTPAVTAVRYTIDSNPHGLPVTLNGSSFGVTPQSYAPPPADAANVVTIANGSQNANYCFSQMSGSARAIFYNSVSDTTGSISSVSATDYATASNSASLPAAFAATLHHAVRSAPQPAYAANMLLVRYHAAALQTASRSILRIESGAGAGNATTLGPVNNGLISRVVHVASGDTITALQARLQADPSVADVSAISMRYPLSVTPVTPNDPKFISGDQNQWDLYQIQAPLAWGITEGSPSVSIAIIDTGYDVTAPDLKNKVTYEESVINGTIDTSASAATDVDGHGTNVSGIAAAATNNGIAVAGVGFNTSLQEYRIFGNTASSAGATTADEAQAIYDAISHGAKVISLSLGGVQSLNSTQGIDQSEYDAVQYALSQGISVVAAAGNERSSSVTSIDYPAAYPGVIAVGASALNDTANPGVRSTATEYVASYSNSGPGLALVAPGGDPNGANDPDALHWILNLDTSTASDPSNKCSNSAACLAQFAGTSQATPHVSAAAALLYAINGSFSPAQVRSILMNNADDIHDAREGAGRLNVYRALSAASGQTAVTPSLQNFRAFGYANSGSTSPSILDLTFTSGVPVASDGSFRLSDLPAGAVNYHIAVWDDANGNGIIDAGDFIGTSAACTAIGPCAAKSIAVHPVAAGYVLP